MMDPMVQKAYWAASWSPLMPCMPAAYRHPLQTT